MWRLGQFRTIVSSGGGGSGTLVVVVVLDRAAAAAFDVQLHRDLNWPFDVTGKKVMKATKMEPVPPGCLGSVY